MSGIPGLAGTDHIGFTVPDMEQATRFFVDVIGCTQLFEVGPFIADDDWMKKHLNVHPRAVIRKLRMFRCQNGPAFEVFEYESPDQRKELPRNSDHGGHHIAFYVKDMDAAVAYLRKHGVQVLGDPTYMSSGASEGLTWVYFLAPWGMQLELVSYANGLAYEKTSSVKMWSPL
jgi:catechol 2,3-dioxygenase-like lactoylglutathione lyase family enzyme